MGTQVCMFYFSTSFPHRILPYKSPRSRVDVLAPHMTDRERETPRHKLTCSQSAAPLSQHPISLTRRRRLPVQLESEGLLYHLLPAQGLTFQITASVPLSPLLLDAPFFFPLQLSFYRGIIWDVQISCEDKVRTYPSLSFSNTLHGQL